jgi:hypothetical protein
MSISVNGIQEANSKLSYITTAAFNGSIYQYTTQVNGSTFVMEGQLSAVTTLPSGAAVTAANCPAGRILRVTGRKLYPGANPGLVLGDKYQGTTVSNNDLNHLWVAVFDSVTGLRGFIDPNASLFAIYNTDRNRAFVDVAETAGGSPTRLGPSIYTAGSITAGAGLAVTSGVFSQFRVFSAFSDAAQTLNTTQALGGWISMAPSVTRIVTLPSTASIITALGSVVGASSDIVVYSSTSNNIRLTPADLNTTLVGGGVAGPYVDINNATIRFIIAISGPTTVTLFRC